MVFWQLSCCLGDFLSAPRFGAFEQEMNGEKSESCAGAFVISVVVIVLMSFKLLSLLVCRHLERHLRLTQNI